MVETLLPEEIHSYIREGRLRHSLALLSVARIMPLWDAAGVKEEFFQDPLKLDRDEAAL